MRGTLAAWLAVITLMPAFAGCTTLDERLSAGAAVAAPPLLPDAVRTLVGPVGFVQEAPVAVDPQDPDHWVVIEYGLLDFQGSERETVGAATPVAETWWAVHVTRDAGATWSRHLFADGFATDPAHPLFGKWGLRYPALHFAQDGVLHVAGIAWGGRGAGAPGVGGATVHTDVRGFVARSFDGGETFTDFRRLPGQGPGGGGVLLRGPEGTLASGFVAQHDGWMFDFTEGPDGSLLLAWRESGPYPALAYTPQTGSVTTVQVGSSVRLARSTDGGDTWSEVEEITPRTLQHSYPVPGIGSDGTEYVAYIVRDDREEAGARWIHLAARDAGASSWRVETLPASGMYVDFRVERREAGDRLWVAYAPYVEDAASMPSAVVVLRSDDRGRSWTTIEVARPELPGDPFPLVSVDPQGVAHVTAYHPVAADGTMEYRAWTIRDDVVSDPTVLGVVNANNRTRNIGHQMGLVEHPDGAVAAWIDGIAFAAVHADNALYLRAALLTTDGR